MNRSDLERLQNELATALGCVDRVAKHLYERDPEDNSFVYKYERRAANRLIREITDLSEALERIVNREEIMGGSR